MPAPVQEESFVSSMMGNPIVPVAGISIVALLAGLGVTRLLRRRKQGVPARPRSSRAACSPIPSSE